MFDEDMFYLGTICKRGHEYEKSGRTLRYIKTHTCPSCKDITRVNKNKERAKDVVGNKYIGELCKYKHRYNDTGYSLRYVNYGTCVKCVNGYRKTVKGRHATLNYQKTSKYKEINSTYNSSPNGIIAQRKYRLTEKGIMRDSKYRHKRRAMLYDSDGSYTNEEWTTTLKIFSHNCAYCGSNNKMTIDHVIALSNGGTNDIFNLIPACNICNSGKQANDMETWYRTKEFFTEEGLEKIQRHMETTWI